MNRLKRPALLGALLIQLAGCASNYQRLEDKFYGSGDLYSDPNVVVYRGGKRIEPGPLALNDWYAFTLLDKWRISHAWLSGPVGINYCGYSHLDNAGLAHSRFFEVDGKLMEEYVARDAKRYGQKRTSIGVQGLVYGIDTRTGEFKGYSPFCSHEFSDIRTGVNVTLIRPDPARGTDRWIANAQRVSVNGLVWLKQSAPIKDSDEVRRQRNAVIERWVLEIPQSPYWLVIGLGGSRSSDGKSAGIDRDPEKFSRVLDLVHQMVASVRVDPIDAPLPMPTLPVPTKGGAAAKG